MVKLLLINIKSNYDPARLFGGKRDEKGWAAWMMEGLPLKMRVLVSPAGYRAEWAGPDGKERWRLVGGRGGDAHLIDWSRGTLLSVGKLRGIDHRSRVEVAWKDGRDPELGLLRRAMCHLELVGDESARLNVEALPASVGGFPSMSHLWSALVPWLGDGIESLGLPIGIRLELPQKGGGSAELRLDSLEPADVPTGAFDLPEGLKEVTPNRHRKRRMPEHLEDGQERGETATSGEACAPAAGLGAALLTGMGPETVKVVFNQSVLDAVFADVGTATSYITGFSGTRFSFHTADWFDQVVQNAPVPANGQTSSVIPALMVRAFLGQICPMLRELGLSETNQDVAAAIEALPDTDNKRKLQEFRSTVLQRGLQAQFQQLLERVVPGLAPSSPAAADDMACAELVLEDLGPPSRSFPSEPFVQLAVAWYGLLLPTLDVRPKRRTRKEIEDAVALFRANGEVDMDGLAELVDINLDAFEHSVTFGSLPLFTTPTYVDTAGLRTIGQRHPWFRPLQDIRFGFTTEFRLAGAAVSCGVDITPTLSAATVALAIFCPPCLLSLFMTGSASATVEDARFPVFLYVEQDPLRLNHPRWRAVFAEPQFGDVNASVVLIGFNWILALLMSAIGSVVGDFILEEILKSLGSELGDAADELLESVPLLDAGSIARLGHQPDLIYPPSEESRVAYDAPPRTEDTSLRRSDRLQAARAACWNSQPPVPCWMPTSHSCWAGSGP